MRHLRDDVQYLLTRGMVSRTRWALVRRRRELGFRDSRLACVRRCLGCRVHNQVLTVDVTQISRVCCSKLCISADNFRAHSSSFQVMVGRASWVRRRRRSRKYDPCQVQEDQHSKKMFGGINSHDKWCRCVVLRLLNENWEAWLRECQFRDYERLNSKRLNELLC